MKKPSKKVKKAKQKKRRVVFSAGDEFVTNVPPVERTNEESLRDQQAALGVMAKAMIAGLERQDRETWEINRRYENEPMVPGSVVFHVHQR